MLLHGDHLIQSYDCNCITHVFFCLITLQGLPVFVNGVGLSTYDKASVSIMIKFLIYISLVPVLIWNYNFYCLVLIIYFYLCSFIFFAGKLLCAVTHSNQWISGLCNFGEHESLESLRNFCCFNLYALSLSFFFGISILASILCYSILHKIFLSHCVDSYLNCVCSLPHLKNMGGLLPLV